MILQDELRMLIAVEQCFRRNNTRNNNVAQFNVNPTPSMFVVACQGYVHCCIPNPHNPAPQ